MIQDESPHGFLKKGAVQKVKKGSLPEKEKGGEMNGCKKTGGSDRQFSHIMGDAHQQPFGIDFLLATQVKSAKAHVVFYVAEGCFHIHRTLGPQLLAPLGGEIFASLPAELSQLETDLDLAVALGFGALALEGTILAALALIMPAGTQVPIGRLVLAGVEVGQATFLRAKELVVWFIVFKVIRAELVFANDLLVAVMMGILVEGVVFEIVFHPMLFEIIIILFTAIGCICGCIFGRRFNPIRMPSMSGMKQGASLLWLWTLAATMNWPSVPNWTL